MIYPDELTKIFIYSGVQKSDINWKYGILNFI